MTFKSKSIWKLISKCEKSSWVYSLNQGSTLPSESFRQLDQEISGGFAVRRPDSSLCIPVLQLYRILQHQHVPFCILLGLFLSPYNWKVSFNDWPVTLNPIMSLVDFNFNSGVIQKVSERFWAEKVSSETHKKCKNYRSKATKKMISSQNY